MVQLGATVLGEAGATVDDLKRVGTAGVGQADDVGDGAGRRALRGILHQLGEQVGEVLGDMSGDEKIVERHGNDAPIVLDLTDGNPNDLTELDGWAAATWAALAGEHQKALSVPAHAGGQVVDPVHLGETIRVPFVRLELVDDFELTVDQRLVATSEVDEHVRNAALEQVVLLQSNGLRGSPNVVQALGDLCDLVVALHLEDGSGLPSGRFSPADADGEIREVVLGECGSFGADGREALAKAIADDQKRTEAEQQADERKRTEVAGRALCIARGGRSGSTGTVDERPACLGNRRGLVVARSFPRRRVDGCRVAGRGGEEFSAQGGVGAFDVADLLGWQCPEEVGVEQAGGCGEALGKLRRRRTAVCSPHAEELGIGCGECGVVQVAGLEQLGGHRGFGTTRNPGVEGNELGEELHVGVVDDLCARTVGGEFGRHEVAMGADVPDVADEIADVERFE